MTLESLGQREWRNVVESVDSSLFAISNTLRCDKMQMNIVHVLYWLPLQKTEDLSIKIHLLNRLSPYLRNNNTEL